MKRTITVFAFVLFLVLIYTLTAFAEGPNESITVGKEDEVFEEDVIVEDLFDSLSPVESSYLEEENEGNEIVDTDEINISVVDNGPAESNYTDNTLQDIVDSIEYMDSSAETIVSYSTENTSVETARNIDVNSFYTGALSDYSSKDWYKFSIREAGYISFEFMHDLVTKGTWIAHLYDANLVELVSYSYSASQTEYSHGNIGVPVGTYYIEIGRINDLSTCNYQIKVNYTKSDVWETEVNDDYTTADFINTNISYSGSLCSLSDSDWYKFTIPSAGYMSLGFIHDLAAKGTWKITLYDSNIDEFASYSYGASQTTYINHGNIGVPAGTYYIGIGRVSDVSDVDYQIKINYTESTNWESEFNEDYTTADSIATNTTYFGSLCSLNDRDWYKFTIPSAGYISLSFKNDLAAKGTWNVVLYGENIADLAAYSHFASQTTYINHGNIGVPAGTYYISVGRINDSSDVNYQLKVNYTESTAWETEFNEDYTAANSIATNTICYGSLCSNNDIDWYKISIQKKGMYKLYFNHDNTSTGTWKIILYDSSMSEKLSFSISEEQISYNIDANLSSGTYFFRISRVYDYSDVNYSIHIDEHEHNYIDKIQEATMSSNGKIVKQCACGDIQSTTTIFYPKTIKLSASSYTYDGKTKTPVVTIIGSDGKTISSSNYTVNYTSGRKNVGTYKVRINFKGNYSGSSTLTFKVNPKGTNISKLTRIKKGFKIKWKKQKSQVSGYQIQYATDKFFSRKTTKTIRKNSTTVATYRGLKAKKKYYVRIRTYKTVSGKKFYSSWSPVKTVKPKK